MIALSASSQTGLKSAPDSLTCYTPAEVRKIAKGLTELDFCREQLEINRQIVAKQQELQMQFAIDLVALEQENEDQAKKIEKLKRGRKWWFAGGAATVLVPVLFLVL
jgi:type II secretory pathway component GspD/PulD (secretin)